MEQLTGLLLSSLGFLLLPFGLRLILRQGLSIASGCLRITPTSEPAQRAEGVRVTVTDRGRSVALATTRKGGIVTYENQPCYVAVAALGRRMTSLAQHRIRRRAGCATGNARTAKAHVKETLAQ